MPGADTTQAATKKHLEPNQDSVQIESRDRVFQGYFAVDRYRLRHRLHEGGWSEPVTREIFERGHAAAVLLYDPEREVVVLINQFRPGAVAARQPAWMTEVVAGIIEDGESAEAVALRECEEEAGCRPYALQPISVFLPSPGACSETIQLFLGLVDSSRAGGVHGLDAEGEDILVERLSLAETWARMDTGEIMNGPTLIALQWLRLNHSTLAENRSAPPSAPPNA